MGPPARADDRSEVKHRLPAPARPQPIAPGGGVSNGFSGLERGNWGRNGTRSGLRRGCGPKPPRRRLWREPNSGDGVGGLFVAPASLRRPVLLGHAPDCQPTGCIGGHRFETVGFWLTQRRDSESTQKVDFRHEWPANVNHCSIGSIRERPSGTFSVYP